jgi:hypothetical protein
MDCGQRAPLCTSPPARCRSGSHGHLGLVARISRGVPIGQLTDPAEDRQALSKYSSTRTVARAKALLGATAKMGVVGSPIAANEPAIGGDGGDIGQG